MNILIILLIILNLLILWKSGHGKLWERIGRLESKDRQEVEYAEVLEMAKKNSEKIDYLTDFLELEEYTERTEGGNIKSKGLRKK
jgi:hypothetical protein